MKEQPLPPERATIEDLDADSPPARRVPRIEIGLGLALLLGVVGLALWQWATSEQQAREARAQAAAARAAARTDGLSGTVALRIQANPAGLYTYGAGGWQMLPDSDVLSQIEGHCPDGRLLYDGPDPATNPATPSPTRDPVRPLAGQMVGRRLLLAAPAATAPALLPLPATDYDWYTCQPGGIWANRIAPEVSTADAQGNYPWQMVQQIAYQPFGAASVITPVLPGPHWSVRAAADHGDALLLIGPDDHSSSRANNPDPPTSLYLAAPDGSNLHLLGTYPGLALTASFSPDDHTLLVVLDHVSAPTGAASWTIAQINTLTGVSRILAEGALPDSTAGPVGEALVQFLRQSPRQGWVLLTWPNQDAQQVRLLDPEGAMRTLTVPGAAGYLTTITADPASGSLLLGWVDPKGDSATQATLLYLDRNNYGQVVHQALPPRWELAGAWVRGDQVIYAGANSLAREEDLRVYSRPRAGFGDSAVQTTTVLSATVPAPWGMGAATWRAGPGMLAYRTLNGELRARRYDGSGDVLLQTDAALFFDRDDQP